MNQHEVNYPFIAKLSLKVELSRTTANPKLIKMLSLPVTGHYKSVCATFNGLISCFNSPFTSVAQPLGTGCVAAGGAGIS